MKTFTEFQENKCERLHFWESCQLHVYYMFVCQLKFYSRLSPSQTFSKNVINISKLSHFPQDYKVSTDPKNFRSIMLLPIASNVRESNTSNE